MVIIPSTMYVVWAESRKPCVDRPWTYNTVTSCRRNTSLLWQSDNAKNVFKDVLSSITCLQVRSSTSSRTGTCH
jgi:hypothetical protein